jgi:hypothetical protein
MLVEIWIVKAILMRSQIKMSILLKTGIKAILVIIWQRIWLNCVLAPGLYKKQKLSDELVCQAEEISKQNTEGGVWLLVNT